MSGRGEGPPRRFSVCVFCGSRVGNDPAYHRAAQELGTGLAQRGWRLVYGGGEVGLMGEVARAALSCGGEVLGVIPQRLMDREVGKRDVSELVVTATMFERKERMLAASDAFVALPGGFGTLDELLEVITLAQLGYVEAPIVLTDIAGIWQPLLAAFDEIVARGFAEQRVRDLVTSIGDIQGALAFLERFAPAGR
jgi:uncharacterized protein (TIGR00730 family)